MWHTTTLRESRNLSLDAAIFSSFDNGHKKTQYINELSSS